MAEASGKPTRKRPANSRAALLDDPAVVAELLGRISEGRGVWEVCQAADMPTKGAVYRRMAVDPAFADLVSRARAAQQDAISDQMDQIAREATPETWQVARLRIWTQQWNAARLAPKKYGTTTKHEVGGMDGALPLSIRIDSLSDRQLEDLCNRLQRRIDDLTPEGEL